MITYGEGVPVGWMISNKEDRTAVLNVLKGHTGPICIPLPSCLMMQSNTTLLGVLLMDVTSKSYYAVGM